ncbi:hypothetical protein BRADI_5g09334v3 [Brachypodium distachyon]|uniref:Uncharacterized protein n=1 Tax=Brachypodium distachyon TaxID=15368 RepID=A0A2K2CG72_BRADI|nr:hypothetical protein BRADI_5g09334v3 [Brachypodium distachyon]
MYISPARGLHELAPCAASPGRRRRTRGGVRLVGWRRRRTGGEWRSGVEEGQEAGARGSGLVEARRRRRRRQTGE